MRNDQMLLCKKILLDLCKTIAIIQTVKKCDPTPNRVEMRDCV